MRAAWDADVVKMAAKVPGSLATPPDAVRAVDGLVLTLPPAPNPNPNPSPPNQVADSFGSEWVTFSDYSDDAGIHIHEPLLLAPAAVRAVDGLTSHPNPN